MPERWQTVRIGDVLVSAQYGLNLPVKPDGTVPIIGMKDMVAGRVENTGWGCVDLPASSRARFLLRDGDILLNRTNSPDLVGKAAIWDRSEGAVFPSYIVRFRADEDQADASFLNYVLNSDDGQTRLKRLSTRGVSQANINPTTFRQVFTLALPPVVEQRRIAAVLDTWNYAVLTAERLTASAERRQAAISHCLFTNDHAATGTLSDYFIERKERGRSGLPVYSVTLENGLIPREQVDRRTESALTDDAHALVECGDLAYNMMRMWQGALGYADQSCLVSPAYVVMQPLPSVDVGFAAAWMKSPRGLDRLWAYSHGITEDRLRLYADDFLAIPVSFPPLDRQRAIGRASETAAQAAREALSLAGTLRRQKRGLMQKLLTGEWRVTATGDAFAPGSPAVDRLEAAE